MPVSKTSTQPGASSETNKKKNSMTKCVATEPEVMVVLSSKGQAAHTTKTFSKMPDDPTDTVHPPPKAVASLNNNTRRPPTKTTMATSTPSTQASIPKMTPRSRLTNKTSIRSTQKRMQSTSSTSTENVREELSVASLSTNVIRGSNLKSSCAANNRRNETITTT